MRAPNRGDYHDCSSSSCTVQPWGEKRSAAEDIRIILEAHGLTEWARRIERCSEYIHFTWVNGIPKPVGTHFCRVRACPICAWRRSLMLRARLYEAIPKLQDAFPKARWLLLTLTVRNCPVDELRDTLHRMSRAWNRLLLRPELERTLLGWFRAVEITRGKDGSAHPHYHCLLLVRSSYFGRHYVSQKRWKQLWQEAMRLDYSPIVDVRAIDAASIPIKYVAKYSAKPLVGSDAPDTPDAAEWQVTMLRQIHGRRLVAAGGVLRQAFRYLEDVRELERQERRERQEDDSLGQPDLTFVWDRRKRRYKRLLPQCTLPTLSRPAVKASEAPLSPGVGGTLDRSSEPLLGPLTASGGGSLATRQPP